VVNTRAVDPEADERHFGPESGDVCGAVSHRLCLGAEAVYHLFPGVCCGRIHAVHEWCGQLYLLVHTIHANQLSQQLLADHHSMQLRPSDDPLIRSTIGWQPMIR